MNQETPIALANMMTDTVEVEGIVKIQGANAVWIEPVLVLSSSYAEYQLSHDLYYARSVLDNRNRATDDATGSEATTEKGSRKRKRKNTYAPNEKEVLAELRHQEARLAILNAHSCFLTNTYATLSSKVTTLDSSSGSSRSELCLDHAHQPSSSLSRNGSENCDQPDVDVDFRQLAEVWQAPFYELTVPRYGPKIMPGGYCNSSELETAVEEEPISEVYPLFDTFIENPDEERVAHLVLNNLWAAHVSYQCASLKSDVTQVRQLISKTRQGEGEIYSGYNLIVIDPPWENKSVSRKSLYPMMPNRQLFSLPVKELAHRENGALVALWLTNREKFHHFVLKELFPAWGVKLVATWYWLKLNASGAMISPLDLQHHKPYECLLLGYLFDPDPEASWNKCPGEAITRTLTDLGRVPPPDKFVVMSVPGDHSRKPPLGSLLLPYAPGPSTPMKGIELFARELNAGWTSWGNEPLHFQNLKYFHKKS